MSESVLELIAENIKDTVNGITEAAGYSQTLVATRPSPVDIANETWEDLTVWINQAEAEELDSAHGTKEWRQFFLLVVFFVNSNTDVNPVDSRCNKVFADIITELMKDHTRDGNANYTDIHSATFYDVNDEGTVGMAVKISIDYRTKFEDPYTRV